MADQEQKALQLIAEAEKKLKSAKGVFSSFFGGGGSKQEEACDLYVRAANAFKMAKKWPEAGKAFEEAAQLQLAMGGKYVGATHYVDAGNCYRKADSNAAVSAIHKAIKIYVDMDRVDTAAKHHITVAEIYENELADMEKAVQNYEQAADYYKEVKSNSSANKCYQKVAQFSATLEKYEKAIKIYEQIATFCMEISLLKYSANDNFFRSSICHLCMDPINASVAVKKYEEMFPAFGDSRECKLIKKLLESIEAENVHQFTEVLQEYDSISRLDPVLTTLLLRVKKQLNSKPDLC